MKVFEPYFTDASKETAIDLSISPIQAVGVAPQYIVDYGNDFSGETPGGTKITTGKKASPTDVQIDYNAPGDAKSPGYMVISKEDMTIKALDKQGRVIYSFPIAVGKGFGNKKAKGDMKTPEGEFSVSQIQDSSKWTHDFGDGKGVIQGAYGPWFIRLNTPGHTGIGIHGTHDPASMGTRASEGCIRLRNEDIAKLRALVTPGMKVIVQGSRKDAEADGVQYVAPKAAHTYAAQYFASTPSASTGSSAYTGASLAGWQKPNRNEAIPYNVVQGKNVGHMKSVTDLFDRYGIQYRVSSGVRGHKVGTSGGRSWHLAGRGLDIAAPYGMTNDAFLRQFVGNKALLDEMKALNYGIINEYIAANRKKTGATGPHLHIGPDTWAWNNHAEFYNPNMALYGQKGVKIPEIKKEMADQYTRGAWKLEKLSNELSIFPKSGSVLSQAIVDRLNDTNVAYTSSDIDGDPNIAGMYNKVTGDVVVREDAGRNTIVHELAHASNPELQKARIAQLKKLYGNQLYKHEGQAPSEYLDSEGEIYARLKATCDSLGIDLSKNYTDEELDKIFLKASKGKTYRYLLEGGDGSRTVKTIEVDEDGNTTSNTPTPRGAKIIEQSVSQVFEGDDNMLNRYNPRFIKTLIKELVSVDPKKDNTRRV